MDGGTPEKEQREREKSDLRGLKKKSQRSSIFYFFYFTLAAFPGCVL